MGLFIISIILPIVFVIVAFFFLCRAFKHTKDESNRFNILATIVSLFLTIYFGINIKPPTPIILPLDNETHIYSDNAIITIESGGFDVYYSLDGSNPQNGRKYEEPIIITSSTTVVARSKFFLWWSEPYKSAYRFESIPITYSNELDLLLSNKLPSARELLDYTITIIIIIAILWSIIRKGLRNIRDRIRSFFEPWL